MKRLALTFAVAFVLSCSATPNLLPVNDLNRPMDVTFVCFGAYDPSGTGQLTVSGRPMRACHPPDVFDPVPSTTSRTFAFMPESGSGALTVVDADHWKLVDLDRFTGGYGQAPLGDLPSQISASDDGCRLLTANRGSCDLSLVDPSVLVAPTFYAQQSHNVIQPSPRTATMTIRPVKSDGTFLTASPYEAVFLPQDTGNLVNKDLSADAAGPPQLCSADGTMAVPPGWPAPATPGPWYAMVTYPSCDLVAVIALPSGQIISSAHVRPTADGKSVTLVDAGTAPSCPVDCSGQTQLPGAAASSPDGGSVIAASLDAGADGAAGNGSDAAVTSAGGAGGAASDAAVSPADAGSDASTTGMAGAGGAGGAGLGGAGGSAPTGAVFGNQYPDVPYVPTTAPISPSGIAILPDGSRAYVGLANASYVLSIGLTSAGLTLPANAIYLHDGARGAARVRLNVDPYRAAIKSSPGQAGIFVGAQIGANMEEPSEGGAAVDFDQRRYLYAIAQDGTVRVVSVYLPGAETECETNLDAMNLPAGVTANTACAKVDREHRRPFAVGPGIHFPALPIDVAAADVRSEPTEDHSEQSVNGAHAWVLTASGVVYLVNINPVLRHYAAAVESNGYAFTPTAPDITEPEPFVNTLRDRSEVTYSVTLDPVLGPAAGGRAPQRAGHRPVHRAVLDAGGDLERHRRERPVHPDGRVLPAGTEPRQRERSHRPSCGHAARVDRHLAGSAGQPRDRRAGGRRQQRVAVRGPDRQRAALPRRFIADRQRHQLLPVGRPGRRPGHADRLHAEQSVRPGRGLSAGRHGFVRHRRRAGERPLRRPQPFRRDGGQLRAFSRDGPPVRDHGRLPEPGRAAASPG